MEDTLQNITTELKQLQKSFYSGGMTDKEKMHLAFHLADLESTIADQLLILVEVEKMEQIVELREDLKPVGKFFKNIQKKPALSRMSKAEKEAYEEEALDIAIATKAMQKLAKQKRG